MNSRGNGKLLKPIQVKDLFTKELSEMPAGRRCAYMRDPNSPGSFVLQFGNRTKAHIARVDAVNFADTVETT